MTDVARFPRPQQPVFETVAQARLDRKQKLAASFRILGKLGMDQGVMGHISARDPENPNHIWMNPFAVSFNRIKVSDLIRVSLDGELIEGKGLIHPGGFPTHAAVLTARPDVLSVAHTHSVYGTAWSAQNRLLLPISAESSVFYNRHSLYNSYALGERENLAQALGHNKAIIFRSHGLFTVGQSVDEAIYLFLLMEKVCQVQLAAEATGQPLDVLPPEQAQRLSDFHGAYQAWLNFQPSFNSIIHEQPDLLD